MKRMLCGAGEDDVIAVGSLDDEWIAASRRVWVGKILRCVIDAKETLVRREPSWSIRVIRKGCIQRLFVQILSATKMPGGQVVAHDDRRDAQALLHVALGL